MTPTSPQTAMRAFLYGSAAMLLLFDVFYFFRALLTSNFIPLVPVIIGILTAGGLLLIVYAEQRAREEDKRDHRRISRVAHQLESPLHALQENFEQLAVDAQKLPAEHRLKLKHMETKTKVLLENVRDVFLLLQAQEQPLAREQRVYNLCTLVETVLEKHTKLASARNVELIHKAHCADAPVKVDRQLFFIALSHLVENAVLYTLTPGLVNVAITKGDKKARVIIQDRGIGIGKKERNTMWQPFARGERAEHYDADGIGVGLTLSRLLIREMGGELRYTPRDTAMGSEFEIVLPLAKTS